MGEPVKQALKEAERAAKKQKLCADVSTSGILAMLRNLVAAREQVSVCSNVLLRLRYMQTRRLQSRPKHHGYFGYRMSVNGCLGAGYTSSQLHLRTL